MLTIPGDYQGKAGPRDAPPRLRRSPCQADRADMKYSTMWESLDERRQNEHQLGREDMPQEPAFITGGLHTGEESGDEHKQHQQQDTPVAQRRQEADFRQRDAAQDHHKRTDDGEHRKGVGEPHGSEGG